MVEASSLKSELNELFIMIDLLARRKLILMCHAMPVYSDFVTEIHFHCHCLFLSSSDLPLD